MRPRHVLRLLVSLVLLAPPLARAQTESVRLPADHEANPSLLIGASQMMFHHEETLLAIARALDGTAPLFGLLSNDAQVAYLRDLLARNDLPKNAVRPIVVSVQSMWVRDYGPLFLRGAGGVALIDPRYVQTEMNPDDDAVPRALAEHWKLPVVDVPLHMDGGHVLSNGDGLVLVSNALVNRNVQKDGLDGPGVFERIRQSLPFDDLEILLPLRGEPTGHLDMFLAFLDVDRLAVARLDPARDPVNAERLDAIAAKMSGRRTSKGPLRIERIDQPAAHDGLWRTYTNAALVGDVVLVPSYPDVDASFDEEALAAWQRWFPARTVRPIDARSLVQRRGALHCVSIPLPPAVHRAALAAESDG